MSLTAVHPDRPSVSPPMTTINPRAVRDDSQNPEIVGDSDCLKFVLSRVALVADTDATVLLEGETGTGKELVARAITRASRRRDGNFVVINCAALPATLIESELFGRERGAFTGAHAAQAGRFELAHHGTIFLDEIGELPLELQPRLLRVLQTGQVERLGGSRTIGVDARIIAATNRDLTQDVRDGRFRRDLYYRLNVFPITLPALRDRRSDIPMLVRHLVEKYSRLMNKPIAVIPPRLLGTYAAYDWPGNIRELENVVQRAVILSRNAVLDVDTASWPQPGPAPRWSTPRLADVEKQHVQAMLTACRWRIEGPSGAAAILGLKPSTLRSRMAKLGVMRPPEDQITA